MEMIAIDLRLKNIKKIGTDEDRNIQLLFRNF